jgi:predicted phage baseplate assembly protein
LPLPAPILDDRSYQQIRDELIRRIPVYAKDDWTDHNPSDPGVTLIELFAFLGENLLYRFNQIPEATKLAFLRMLQIPLRPASAARALLTLALKDAIPAGLLVDLSREAKAGDVSFETLNEVRVWPLEAVAVGRVAAPAPTAGEAKDFATAALDARGGLKPGEQAAFYQSATVPEDPTAPGAMPVNIQATVDGALWIAVLQAESIDTPVLENDLRKALGKGLLNVGFVPDEEIQPGDPPQACPGESPRTVSAEVVWEASTGQREEDKPYREIAVESDTTRGLTQQGVVRLRLPDAFTELGVPRFDTEPDLAGTGVYPPGLEDEKKDARVLFWLRASRRRSEDAPLGRVLFVGINATEVVQTLKAGPEFLGTGNAQASQVYPLVHRPVLAGSVSVQVEEDGRWMDWQVVDGFDASVEDSRHCVIDLEAGTVRFGNALRGRAPQIGERIRVREYRWGGGPDGNVGPKAIAKIEGVDVDAANPLPARGGAPAEPVADALERVPSELRRRDRAVTEGDFQELALATPGADVGRAECIPLFHPPTRNLQAAGVVSVVVWPRVDRKHPDAPVPDRTLLRQVCCWLDARRLITTELYVIPPTYRKVAVAVGLEPKPGYGVEAVRRWVELVIRQYLAPLPPYGPDGRGWPLGRPVFGPELEAAALQVEGVEFLYGLNLAHWDGAQWVQAATVDCLPQPIALERWEVPQLAEITVVQNAPLDPGEAVTPPPTPSIPIPIPTLREEC